MLPLNLHKLLTSNYNFNLKDKKNKESIYFFNVPYETMGEISAEK